jgi:general L-amino acid transport system permease protein
MSEAVQKFEPGMHPDMPPPAGQRGLVLWLRTNLFSSWANTIMTITAAYFLYLIIPPMLNWAIFDAVLNAGSRIECREIASGACWAFIENRAGIMIYGFYPDEQIWRINLAFIMMLMALVPILFDNVPFRKQGLIYACTYPFIAAWLLLGGLGLEPVSTEQFGGAMLNMIIGITGIAFSFPIGVMLALGRQSHLPIVKTLSVCFIEFIRGVPLITLLFVASTMLNYFLPPGTTFDLLLRVLIMVTLFASAYMAEVIRGGLQAIPSGQYEAANSMGLKYWQAMRLIILPQALKISIPGIVNTFIGLFKDTTLVLIIGMLDILGIMRSSLADATWNGLPKEGYIAVAIFFVIPCFAMSRYSIYLEKKLDRGHKR